ncbi:MAG: acyl-CoA dehydrogenase family protein [Myxococcota bacterium]|nr:acyl-CoA dehydrogenase family protein [Myxococcota bacterium]
MLSEEQRMLQQMVRDLGRTRGDAQPTEMWAAMGALGLLGVRISEEMGGAGMDGPALRVVLESLASFSPDIATQVMVHNLCVAESLQGCRSDASKATLAQLVSGELMGVGILNVTSSGHLGFATTLRSVDTPAVVVSGTDVEIYEESLRESSGQGALGLSGLNVTAIDAAMATWSRRSTWTLESVGTGVSSDVLWGLAAILLGLARAAFDTSVRYASERVQFGRPISDFQAIQWMIADSDAELDGLEMLVGQAAENGDERSALNAAVFGVDVARSVTDRALQMHGGYGYTKEYGVEQHWRDARFIGDVFLGGALGLKAHLGREGAGIDKVGGE